MNFYLLQGLGAPGVGHRVDGPVPRFFDLGQIVSELLPIVFSLAAFASFIFLLIGAFKYLASAGDEKALMSAKSTIAASLIGFLVVFVSYWIIKIVEGSLGISIFGGLAEPSYAADVRIQDKFAPNSAGTSPFNKSGLVTFADFVSKFLPAVFGVSFIAFFLYFLAGAVSFISSGGDEKTKAAAKHRLSSAFIGLLLVLISYWIIRVVERIIVGSGNPTLF